MTSVDLTFSGLDLARIYYPRGHGIGQLAKEEGKEGVFVWIPNCFVFVFSVGLVLLRSFPRACGQATRGDSRVFLYLEFRMGRTYMVGSLFFDALLALEGEREGGKKKLVPLLYGMELDGGKDERRSSIGWECTDVFETNETTVRAFVSLHTNHVCVQWWQVCSYR